MKKLSLLAALTAGVSLVGALPAGAIIVTVNSQQYDITTINTTYDSNTPLPQSQPWWGNASLAQQFAVAVFLAAVPQGVNATISQAAAGYTASSLGFESLVVPSSTRGPLFAYAEISISDLNAFRSDTIGTSSPGSTLVSSFNETRTQTYPFAQATAVPLETDALPIVGSVVFMGAGLWFKRRRAQAKANLDFLGEK